MKFRLIFVVMPLLLGAINSTTAQPGVHLKKAPLFMARTLDGSNFSLADRLGRGPVIINFWATWCQPCFVEMQELKKIQTAFGGDSVQIFSVSIDDPQSFGAVAAATRSQKLPFTILLDPSQTIYKLYKVANIPQMFVIDVAGNIVYEHTAFRKGDEMKVIEVLNTMRSTTGENR